MVKLLEWQGKDIFQRYGISMPRGVVARSAEEVARAIGKDVLLPAVIKAQVLSGGRGKGGAIQFAKTEEEAKTAAAKLIGSTFKGERIREVLVEERLSPSKEFYLSITLDRYRRCPILMFSREGGMEVESLPEEKMGKAWIHPQVGVVAYEERKAIRFLGLKDGQGKELSRLIQTLWKVFSDEEAELVEINPLSLVGEKLIALDAKVIIEDDALFRHPDYDHLPGERSPLEEKAYESGIAFVEMGGNVGVIANGAGLTMATLDVLLEHGGKPGVFLDLGGTDDPKKVAEAFSLMSQANPKVVFINIFGGVTRCDTVAEGLVEEMRKQPPAFPFVTRIRGHNETEGMALLKRAGIETYSNLAEAVRHVVALGER